MRVFAWNIQQGGGRRIGRLMRTVVERRADTVVLGETSRTRFAELATALTGLGFRLATIEPPPADDRGVLIATTRPFRRRAPSARGVVARHRWSEVWFPEARFALAGLYFPDTAKPIQALWPRVIEAADRRRAEDYFLTGDLNSGQSAFDTEGATLSSDPWFSAMPFHGMVDLWRHRHRDKREYTWYSHARNGKRNGFRLDHVFGTHGARRRLGEVRYFHEDRAPGLSDHSSLLFEVR
jgi:exodeoxyribonuclease-3